MLLSPQDMPLNYSGGCLPLDSSLLFRPAMDDLEEQTYIHTVCLHS